MGGIRWILDGYNVMYALRFLPTEGTLELARDRFMAWVHGFASLGDITIVFDARGSHERENECPSAVRVIYGTDPMDADGTILTLIRQTKPSKRSRLTVVTRDLLLRDRIFSYGSVVISPEAFWSEYQRRSQAEQSETSRGTKHFYRPFKDFFEKNVCGIKGNGR
ncbi:MAG: NYN domain-containing protein [Opitutales bacterium]|nr:NYN domain-containing protein [Opitutales bacterium]